MAFEAQEIQLIITPLFQMEQNTKKPRETIMDKVRSWLNPVDELDGEDKITPYSLSYVLSVNHARQLSIHADGTFPWSLIGNKAPNEHPDEFEYRRLNYQPISKPVWSLAKKTVNRIWNPMNYTVDWPSNESDVLVENPPQAYFEKEYPNTGTIYTYFSNIITDKDLKDPNAVIAVKPMRLPTKRDENNDLVVDETRLTEPIAVAYASRQVIEMVEDLYTVILLDKKVRLEDDTDGNTGLVWEFYDDQNIWTINQAGTKKNPRFEIQLFYNHALGYVPVKKLPGIQQQEDGEFYNESYFEPALPSLNEAVIDNSNLFAIKAKSVFPQSWAIISPCKNNQCEGGRVWDNDDGEYRTCPVCKGGRSKTGPLTTVELEIPPRFDPEQAEVFKSIPIPPFGTVSPSAVMPEFLDKQIDKNLFERAFSFVSINVSGSKVKAGEPALSKQIDREELFAFLMLLSQQFFGLLGWTIDTIGMMRYDTLNSDGTRNETFVSPSISPPVDFRIRSEKELVEEIEMHRKAGSGTSVLRRLYGQYYRLRFGATKDAEDILRLQFFVDTQLPKTPQQVTIDISANRIQLWQKIIYDQYENLLSEILLAEDMDRGKFFDMPLDQQAKTIEDLAKTKATQQTIPAPNNLQSILDAANQT